MILYLNLLPKEERKNIRYERLASFLKTQIIFLLVIALTASGVVFFVKSYLEREVSVIEAALEKSKQSNTPLIHEVAEFNMSVEEFSAIQDGYASYVVLLSALISQIPRSITLSSISYSGGTGILSLEGFYKTRDGLLLFKKNLDENLLTDIEFPLTNLLKEKDGEFAVRGKVKKETL
jgi:Tfp pilus assembly protein PilN